MALSISENPVSDIIKLKTMKSVDTITSWDRVSFAPTKYAAMRYPVTADI
jgi:hypothetical protein